MRDFIDSNMNLQLLRLSFFVLLIGMIVVTGCNEEEQPSQSLEINSIQVQNQDLLDGLATGVELNAPIIISFNLPISSTDLSSSITIKDQDGQNIGIEINTFNQNKNISIYPSENYQHYSTYTLTFTNLPSEDGSVEFSATDFSFQTIAGSLVMESIISDGNDLTKSGTQKDISLNLDIQVRFSAGLDEQTINSDNVFLKWKGIKIPINTAIRENLLTITAKEPLKYWNEYELVLDSAIKGIGAYAFGGFQKAFITELDSSYKFEEISDDALLTKIQEQTFKYFWDYGHPTSGLSRERLNSGETVTIGGSGFGVMSIIVGIERGFISREEGVNRWLKIVNFLQTKADRFHGVWPHWLNGETGATRPFSTYDDGGDLVESAFMLQGLLTVRQYLDDQNTKEAEIISKINELWNEVEWDWYQQNGQNVLYWHWSANHDWQMNMRVTGWNESLIVYLLAASSTTHTIDKAVYTNGWARNGGMANGNSYYDIELPLGYSYGGPLFFTHYSFLGLDPRNLSDQYANYWTQNVNHSKINYSYCVDNPKNYLGYSSACWGLTASDNYQGYSAHSPTNDLGVITPTAAISSIPYTPEESMKAIRFFYYLMGDRIFGDYGFKDAFAPKEGWYASSYLAIDQGPIILMIENYRTGLLWDLFMLAPEVQNGLDKLGFTYE